MEAVREQSDEEQLWEWEKNMITVELENFSLREICQSGQCFRMRETAENNTYELIAGDKYLKISQEGSIVNFYCSDVEFICYWVPYFDIDSDYGRYIEKVNPRDKYLSAAVQCGNGIRILRQDLWEMIITFLISQQNNISRIRGCIDRLCVRYGKKLETEGTEYYSFPTPQQLSGATEEELRELGMGYRARYIVETTRSILNENVSLEKLYQMKYYRKARKELMRTASACLHCTIWMHSRLIRTFDRFLMNIIAEDFQTEDIMA